MKANRLRTRPSCRHLVIGNLFGEKRAAAAADHRSKKTTWTGAGNAFLARDLNGNGTIDDITELFGNATQSGFAALAGLDSNGDQKIDAADTAFASLRVWQDTNGNGVTDAGELLSLAQAGIASISLAASAPASDVVAGNILLAAGSFARSRCHRRPWLVPTLRATQPFGNPYRPPRMAQSGHSAGIFEA